MTKTARGKCIIFIYKTKKTQSFVTKHFQTVEKANNDSLFANKAYIKIKPFSTKQQFNNL